MSSGIQYLGPNYGVHVVPSTRWDRSNLFAKMQMDADQKSDPIRGVAEALQNLGDPSGRQDRMYWDDWFEIVGRRPGSISRTFEWYCTAQEVVRVVQFHVSNTAQEEDPRSCHAMIHPGSGTSLLPIVLKEVYPCSRQVVVDVSPVAMAEIQAIHAEQLSQWQCIHHEGASSSSSSDGLLQEQPPIEYVIMDLLKKESETTNDFSLEDASFDCWMDKGFVDAIFSHHHEAENLRQSALLFQKANRLLLPGTGVAIVVSLAEEHSLRVIVANWLNLNNEWHPVLHIWELHPISGEILPFAFCLTRTDMGGTNREDHTELRVGLHRMGRSDDSTLEFTCLDRSNALEQIQAILSLSRERFRAARQTIRDSPKLWAVIEIKPCAADVNWLDVSHQLCAMKWSTRRDSTEERTLEPKWQPCGGDEDSRQYGQIIPIGYGITKLQLQCVIRSDDLEDLVALMEEWDTDVVQSVDVDWSQTFPIATLSDVAPHV